MKKFAKLNLDDDLAEQLFEDEKVGPCKPGCAFWKLLARGPPLQLPIPETLTIGANNLVRFLHNEPNKGVITSNTLHFDVQSDRDEFIHNCLQRYVGQSMTIASPPEPLYSRFIAVQKRPAIKSPRIYITQQSDFLIPIAFQAQLLEIADGNLPPCIIQKFIKSRGKRPSIYRLFWKRAGNETGCAEGWNITTRGDEFIAPDLISLDAAAAASTKVSGEDEQEMEETTFKRQTTKFIASYIRAGELQMEHEQPKDALDDKIQQLQAEVQQMTFKPFSAPLAKQIAQKVTIAVPEEEPESSDKTFVTAPSPLSRSGTLKKMPTLRRQDTFATVVMDRRQSTEEIPKAMVNTNMDFTSYGEGVNRKTHSVDYFTGHSPEKTDELFLKGMTSRLYMSSGERTQALLINAKANSSLGYRNSASITSNDGELSEEKCSKLTATRVSSAALAEPIHHIAQLAHWYQICMRDMFNLNILFAEAVVDFIKDDQGRWWFINLKSFKLTEDCLPKVISWHATKILHKPEPKKKRPLSSKERKAKHIEEAGTMCALCGVYYMHGTVELRSEDIDHSKADPITHVPAFGYQIALQAARIVAGILNKYQIPPTALSKALLKVNDSEDINSRSVKQLLQDQSAREGVLLHKDGGGDIAICCYRCFGIYSKHTAINERVGRLNSLVGLGSSNGTDDNFSKSSVRRGPGSIAQGSIRPSSARPGSAIRKNQGSADLSAAESDNAIKDNAVDDLQNLTKLVKLIKDKNNAPSNRTQSPLKVDRTFCSYHSIPYGVMHWRVLIMFHYAILEDSEQLNKLVGALYCDPSSPSNMNNDEPNKQEVVPRYFAINYSLGQQTVFVPFLVKHKKLPSRSTVEQNHSKKKNKKKSPNSFNVFKKEQIIPIQECRLHCMCGKPADVVEYLKDMLVNCKMFSMPDNSNLKPEVKLDKPSTRASFMRSISLFNNEPKAEIRPTQSKLQEEATFMLYMNKLKMQKDSQALLDGLEKHDMLITIPTASLSTISIKASVAIVRDGLLPSNMSGVDNFLVDKGGIFHPPSTFVPTGLTLPESWLSMMINTRALDEKKEKDQDEHKMRRMSSRGLLTRDSSDLTGSARSTNDSSDSDSSTSSIDLNDGQDDLIERMLDRETFKEKEAREEIMYQRKQAEEREAKEAKIREQLLAEKQARKDQRAANGEQSGSNVQRLIAPVEKKRWTLLSNTASAIRRVSVGATPALAAESNEVEDSASRRPTKREAHKLILPRTISAPTLASSGEATSPLPKPVAPAPAAQVKKPVEASAHAVDEVPKTEEQLAEEKRRKKNRIMSRLAKALKQRAAEVEGGESAPPSPAPIQPKTLPATSSTGSLQTADLPAGSMATNAMARRQRNFSVINNNMIKFTAFQSSYSASLHSHFEGIEAFMRLFEEHMLAMEHMRVRGDSLDIDGLSDEETSIMAEMVAEHGLDSKNTLLELSSIVHEVAEEFEEYQRLLQAQISAQFLAASQAAQAQELQAITENGQNDDETETVEPSQDAKSPSLSFFTVARVIVKHKSVQQNRTPDADNAGEPAAKPSGHRASIKDFLMTRSPARKGSTMSVSSTGSGGPKKADFNADAHNAAVEERTGDLVANSEIQYLTTALIDAMTLTLRQLTVMEYLPRRITWPMLRPLILESLPTFLMEN